MYHGFILLGKAYRIYLHWMTSNGNLLSIARAQGHWEKKRIFKSLKEEMLACRCIGQIPRHDFLLVLCLSVSLFCWSVYWATFNRIFCFCSLPPYITPAIVFAVKFVSIHCQCPIVKSQTILTLVGDSLLLSPSHRIHFVLDGEGCFCFIHRYVE